MPVGTLTNIAAVLAGTAIGAVAGLMVYEDRKVLNWVRHPLGQAISYAVLLWLYWTRFEVPVLTYSIYGALFAIMIVNVSTNPRSFLKLENGPLCLLGGHTKYKDILLTHLFTDLNIGAIKGANGQGAV